MQLPREIIEPILVSAAQLPDQSPADLRALLHVLPRSGERRDPLRHGLMLHSTRDVLDRASGNGHVAVLTWWRASGLRLKYSNAALRWASANGHLDVLQWWRDSNLYLKYLTKAMWAASVNSRLDVLDWWKASGLPLRYNYLPVDDAGVHGLVSVLEWWKSSGLPLKYTSRSVNGASARGRVDVLEWWKASGLPIKCCSFAIQSALINRNFSVVEWWLSSGLELRLYSNGEAKPPATKLDAILQSPQSGRTILYRVLVIAELLPSVVNLQDVTGYYQHFFKNLQSETTTVTGVLLVHPTVAVHLVEGPRSLVYDYLADLDRKPGSHSSGAHGTVAAGSEPILTSDGDLLSAAAVTPVFFKRARVVLVQDDVARVYPYWLSRAAEQAKQSQQQQAPPAAQPAAGEGKSSPDSDDEDGGGDEENEEDPADILTACTTVAHGLVSLGPRLASLAKADIKAYLDDLLLPSSSRSTTRAAPTSDPMHAITSDLYPRLLASPSLSTPRAWRKAIDADACYGVMLDDQFVWPAPRWGFLAGIRALSQAQETRDEQGKPAGAGAGGGSKVTAALAALQQQQQQQAQQQVQGQAGAAGGQLAVPEGGAGGGGGSAAAINEARGGGGVAV
ncbi:hypothetical protein H9P43_004864 [Blastocladiella emersonii ATCC 22665]|nr:hypothetical protein H9P43_004864 [Blastocladiella emersonii ATCC 22665]